MKDKDKKDFGKKPEFDAEDFAVDAVVEVQKPDGMSKELLERFGKQDEVINELRQLIHNKGLDVGLPSVIVFDINQIAISLNSMRELLLNEALRQKWRDADNMITKTLNRGEPILAHHERMMQVIELREAIGKLDSFLFDLVNRLNRLQRRMIGKDMHDLER